MNEKEEIANQILINNYILAQHDYCARKVVFELAAKIKEKFPEIELPIYESYLEIEEKAQECRDKINELTEKLKNLSQDA